jgi:hypothetical protein
MSLDKAIRHKKENREDYRGSKKIDRSCRNHGTCNYCSGNRQINKLKLDQVIDMIDEDQADRDTEIENIYIK